MIIRIGNLSDTYSLLGGVEQHIEAEEFSKTGFLNQDSEKVATLRKLESGVNISYSQAELFYPLDFADFFVRRRGNVYAANIVIKARQLPAFRSLSSKLIEAFKVQKLEFLPTIEDGAGYIIRERGEGLEEKCPDYSITEAGFFRLICLGSKGADRRVFPDEEKVFTNSISELEKVANIFIDTVYKNHNDLDSIVKVPENFIIEINP